MRNTRGRRLLLGVDRLIGGLCRLGVWLAGSLLLAFPQLALWLPSTMTGR